MSCISRGRAGIFTGMATGTRPQPDAHDIALAAIIRGVMVTRAEPITQTELQKMTGIPQTTISSLLKPKHAMTVAHLRLIARALGVDMGTIITEAERVANGEEDAHAATLKVAR